MVAISGGSIRGRAALQMECEGFSRHTVINFSSASGFEAGCGGEGGAGWWGDRPAGLQLKASNNNRGLSQTKGTDGRGVEGRRRAPTNEKQQQKKSFVYNM